MMKKDIEWLKNRLESLREKDMRMRKLYEPNSVEHRHFNGRLAAIDEVLDFIDELDEPKVLSQELPVIPKYVADWIEAERGTMSNWKLPSRFISDSKYKKDQRRYKWSQVEGNMDKFMSALINSYEVEEEPLYHALVKGHELMGSGGTYWIYDKTDDSVLISKLYTPSSYFLTEMSEQEWFEIGIDDSNAHFVEVNE